MFLYNNVESGDILGHNGDFYKYNILLKSLLIENRDILDNVGLYTATATNPNNGHFYIAYYHVDYKTLKLATYNGTEWNISTIDSSSNFKQDISIAVNPNNNYIYVSYHDATTGNLKIATHNTSSWNILTVDTSSSSGLYTDIVVNTSDNTVWVSYIVNRFTTDHVKVAYSTNNGSSWTVLTVWVAFLSNNLEYTSISVDLDTGYPHVFVHWTPVPGDLLHFYWNGSTWSDEDFIDGYGGGHNLGLYVSSDIDQNNGNIYVSYQDATTGNLKLATYSEGVWSTEVIVSSSDFVGMYTSLKVNQNNGYIYIVHHNNTVGSFELEWYDGVVWHHELIDNGSGVNDVGEYGSLDLLSFPDYVVLVMGYYDATDDNLKSAVYTIYDSDVGNGVVYERKNELPKPVHRYRLARNQGVHSDCAESLSPANTYVVGTNIAHRWITNTILTTYTGSSALYGAILAVSNDNQVILVGSGSQSFSAPISTSYTLTIKGCSPSVDSVVVTGGASNAFGTIADGKDLKLAHLKIYDFHQSSGTQGVGNLLMGDNSDLHMTNCLVESNQGTGGFDNGGFASILNTTMPTHTSIIKNVHFRSNSISSGYGGVFWAEYGDMVWTNCIFESNSASWCSVILLDGHDSGAFSHKLIIDGCLFVSNSASPFGVCIGSQDNSQVKIYNSTVYNCIGWTSSHGSSFLGIYADDSGETSNYHYMVNVIGYNNQSYDVKIMYTAYGVLEATYCLFENGNNDFTNFAYTNFPSNTSGNPGFVNVSYKDWKLTSSSPAIGSGLAQIYSRFDIRGMIRFYNGNVDKGAYSNSNIRFDSKKKRKVFLSAVSFHWRQYGNPTIDGGLEDDNLNRGGDNIKDIEFSSTGYYKVGSDQMSFGVVNAGDRDILWDDRYNYRLGFCNSYRMEGIRLYMNGIEREVFSEGSQFGIGYAHRAVHGGVNLDGSNAIYSEVAAANGVYYK